MPINWIPVSERVPQEGKRVMVKNSIHCWDTVWKAALIDPSLASPVLLWSAEEVSTLRNAASVDPTLNKKGAMK